MIWLKYIFAFFTKPLYPYPSKETAGRRVFRAPWIWETQVCSGPVAVIAGSAVLGVIAGILIAGLGDKEMRAVGGVFMVAALSSPIGYFVGKFGARDIHAVEIDPGKGLDFYTPLGRTYVPIEEIQRVKPSWLRSGWFVKLKRRRRLLTGFDIDFTWGERGRELAQAIKDELARAT